MNVSRVERLHRGESAEDFLRETPFNWRLRRYALRAVHCDVIQEGQSQILLCHTIPSDLAVNIKQAMQSSISNSLALC